MRKNLLAVLLSTAGFLFFLSFHDNINYLYAVKFLLLSAFNLVSIILMVQVNFVAFALGLFIHKKIGGLSSGGILRVLTALAFFCSSASLINLLSPQYVSGVVILIIILFMNLISLLFGLVTGAVLRDEKNGSRFSQNLMLLVAGTIIATAIYTLFLSEVPHHVGYFFVFYLVFSAKIWIIAASEKVLKWKALTVNLAWSFFLLALWTSGAIKQVDLSRIGDSSVLAFTSGERILQRRDDAGTLDVIRNSLGGRTSYYFLNNWQSPSTVSVKGDYDGVEPQARLPYKIKTIDRNSKVLIIGVGGGQDIVAALHHGAGRVVGVEVDGKRLGVMTNELRSYSNDLFFDPRVTIYHGGAQEFLRETREKFDLIVIQRPHTAAWVNSYIYDVAKEMFTATAFHRYAEILEDDGILYMGMPGLGGGGEDSAKLQNNAFFLDGLRDGITDFKERLLLFELGSHGFLVSIFGASDTINQFRKQNTFNYLYHPGMKVEQGDSPITDTLFFAKKSFSSERQVYGIYDPAALKKSLLLAGLVMLLVFVAAWLTRRNEEFAFFCFGLGYELILLLFVFWLSYFYSNFIDMLSLIFVSYYALGVIGYWLASRFKYSRSYVTCFTIMGGLLLVDSMISYPLWQLADYRTHLVVFFCFMGILNTVPFGVAINHSSNPFRGLVVDNLGMTVSTVLVFILPNLDTLLVFTALIYALAGMSLLGARLRFGA